MLTILLMRCFFLLQFPLDPANASHHFKKFVYNFDHPNIVSECGTVDVYDNLVIAHFPRKINGSTTSSLIEKILSQRSKFLLVTNLFLPTIGCPYTATQMF